MSSFMDPGMSSYMSAELGSFPDHAESWQNPAHLGDFYRNLDDVTRSVTMAPPTKPCPHAFDKFGHLSAHEGSLQPGVTGLSADAYFDSGMHFDDSRMVPSCVGKLGFDVAHDCDKIPYLVAHIERFQERDVPPPSPSDPLFIFETTTFFISHNTPSSIGNRLLDFLGSEVVASVTKVSRRKYTIKADVFVDAVMCTLKIRVYSWQGRYAVEFQRRSGNCVTFNNAYQLAAKYLKLHFLTLENGPKADDDFIFTPLPLMPETNAIQKEDLTPLLDMASLTDLPSLQAESAASLADIAKDIHTAECLCSHHAFKEIMKLLQSDQMDVAYPTARLLSFLARCPKATPCFVDHELLLLPKILDKLASGVRRSESRLVQQELAQVVLNASANLSEERLDAATLQNMILSISETLEVIGSSCGPLYDNLQQARCMLKRQQADAGGAVGWK